MMNISLLIFMPLVVWKSSSDGTIWSVYNDIRWKLRSVPTPLHFRNIALGDERSRRGKCSRRTQRGVKYPVS